MRLAGGQFRGTALVLGLLNFVGKDLSKLEPRAVIPKLMSWEEARKDSSLRFQGEPGPANSLSLETSRNFCPLTWPSLWRPTANGALLGTGMLNTQGRSGCGLCDSLGTPRSGRGWGTARFQGRTGFHHSLAQGHRVVSGLGNDGPHLALLQVGTREHPSEAPGMLRSTLFIPTGQ